MRSRTVAVFVAVALLVLAAGSLRASASDTASDASASEKLRGDLAALVSGEQRLDPRIPKLVDGYRPGELAYFAVLSEPNDAAHGATLTALGARVLRSYRSVDAFALASSPATVLRVAALPWVEWLAPVEIVVPLDQHEVDQSRATTSDVGAPALWDQGLTGTGTTIAVLDTGLDPAHPDLDDQDFRHWDSLLNPRKVVDARNFVGGGCSPLGTNDGHGHGTHVAGIAAGTGEGTPATDDNGKYAGIAPGAQLAVAKVLTDAGAGLNSDLVAAMEWAAMPSGSSGCAVGADIVNMSIGSESRPGRLNSDSDVDFVSYALDRLAVRYGTLFVGAAGNSGPFIGSALEAPGSAAQALSVAAAAKDYDVNHDDTLSGDTCAGWRHPQSPSLSDNDCTAGVGDQPPSAASFSSRGPSGDLWLRPDLAAPGYNIVSAQSSTGSALAGNDLNRGTRLDPLYATASGTSMATPATAGSAALLLQGYRQAYGTSPSGGSGLAGVRAPAYALLRAALMNTAGPDLFEARWILTTDAATHLSCGPLDPITFGFCGFATLITDVFANGLGSLTLYEARNRGADPYVGPLAEGAGKLNVPRAFAALRNGVVIYSAASAGESSPGTGHRDFQGSWQIGSLAAGLTSSQDFVAHAAPGAGPVSLHFAFVPGHPSDGSRAIDSAAWSVTVPSDTAVSAGGDAQVRFSASVPASAPPGTYTGEVLVTTSIGQTLHLPVFASVALHDPDSSAGNAPGPQAEIVSARDVFAKDDTSWPSVVGTPGTGANADWLVFPVELATDLSSARFSVYDTASGRDTYDLYLYDSRFDLVASTHPFVSPGVTDKSANDGRGPSTQADPQTLTLRTPAGGRHYLVVNRAKVGGTTPGSFGAFVARLDEVRQPLTPAATQLSYEGDYVFTQGESGQLTARLTDGAGTPVAGRAVSFVFDGGVAPCAGGSCTSVTDYQGIAQVATDPITLGAGIHEVRASFAGDPYWLESTGSAPVLVVGAGSPGPGTAGHVTSGGWFATSGGRAAFAFHAEGSAGGLPGGELRYRDPGAGVDVTLVAYTSLVVSGDTATLAGSARRSDGRVEPFELEAQDRGEPGRDTDSVAFRLPASSYSASGKLGGGNVQIHG